MKPFPFGEVDVLVVGGGAAGLATGLTLGWLGISTLVVERRLDASTHPRATALTAATMELMRGWGIESEVRQSGFVTQPVLSLRPWLLGPELDRIPMSEHVWTCAQDRLEPILSERTQFAGAPVVYGWEVTQVQADTDEVRATVMEQITGISREVRARFLVGADGASGLIRSQVGIRLSRFRSHGDWMSILFRSPLRTYTGEPPCLVYGITNTDPFGVIVPTDATDRWIRGLPWHPEDGERHDDYDVASCITLIRSAVGIPTLPVAILGVQRFRMAAALAERYRAGRVLLVGDAAHLFTPSTGMGLNVALQDGVTAARCLAQAMRDDGALDALETYEIERRPVAERLLASELATP